MSREIKFRAWHKEEKRFIGFYSYGLHMLENGQIYAGGMNITDRIELLQFTGLHDKNGKEIYEGDIIDHPYGKFVVEWDDSQPGFYLKYQEDRTGEEDFILTAEEPYEVIGNIHDNPYLLEVQP